MKSACSLDQESIGCSIEGSKLWVFSESFRVLVGALPDDLPLLSCHMIGSDRAVVAGAGLCPTEVLLGVIVPSSLPSLSSSLAAEPSKRLRRTDWAVRSHILRVSDRGGLTAVALHAQNEGEMHLLWLFLGCQNGDVVRISLLDKDSAISVVGSEEVVHSHRMDVRGLSLHSGRILSCSDDGTVLLSLLLARSSPLIEPLLVSRDSELLACVLLSESTALVGTRDRRVIAIEFGLEGFRKKKDPSWQVFDVPHVPKSVSVIPGTNQIMFTCGAGEAETAYAQSSNGDWEKINIL